MSEPILKPIKGGFAAHHPTEHWAQHGATEEEARANFRRSEARNRVIDARPLPEERQAVTILYRNHRSETARGRIQPLCIWFGSTEYHREGQWLLKARDLDKGVERDFALRDIREWEPAG
jgi:hypothetical protein